MQSLEYFARHFQKHWEYSSSLRKKHWPSISTFQSSLTRQSRDFKFKWVVSKHVSISALVKEQKNDMLKLLKDPAHSSLLKIATHP